VWADVTVRYDDTGPEDVPWFVKLGDPISKTWLVTDASTGAAIDVSGATLTGAIRTAEDSTLTATATFTMSKPSVSGSNAVKALLSAGLASAGSYWWAIKVAMADGETVYRGQGTLIVEAKGV
jgi:hypothetical protein